MAFRLAEAYVQISERGIKAVSRSLGRVKAGLGGIIRATTSLRSKLLLLGGGIGVGAGAVGLVKLASDAEEVKGKFDAVFGDRTSAVEDWVNRVSGSYRRSRTDLREWVAGLQDTIRPLGFADETAEHMSKTLSRLAIDLASFNNLAEDDAIQRLKSGLIGNHEALVPFGTVINQAVLDQQLLAMGFKASAKGATIQEKVLARLAIILRTTTAAQGDAIRTSASFANQFRGLKAQIADVAIDLGKRLLPAAKSMVQTFGALIASLDTQAIGNFFESWSGWIANIVRKGAIMVANWETTLQRIKAVMQEMGFNFNSIGGFLGSSVAVAIKSIFKAFLFLVDFITPRFLIMARKMGEILASAIAAGARSLFGKQQRIVGVSRQALREHELLQIDEFMQKFGGGAAGAAAAGKAVARPEPFRLPAIGVSGVGQGGLPGLAGLGIGLAIKQSMVAAERSVRGAAGAKRIRDLLRTPGDIFREKVGGLNEARGFLTAAERSNAFDLFAKGFRESVSGPGGLRAAGSISAGSREMFSALARSQSRPDRHPLAGKVERQIAVAEEQQAALERIERKIGAEGDAIKVGGGL